MLETERSVYPFSLDRTASADEIAATVTEFGVAHIEGFLPAEAVDRLSHEAYRLFEDDSAWVAHEPYGLGHSVRLCRREIDPERYPATTSTFEDPFLEQVTAAYYGSGYLFAEHIWVMVDEVESTTIVQQLHYDKLAHLKHFFYLSDVGMENGPFYCVVGTQHVARELQARNRAQGIVPTDDEARAFPSGISEREIPVLGRRGTLIVFDTDVAHRASVPTGGRRLAARSLSYAADSIGKSLYVG